ncbi:MAG TPA: HemK/PrmC family methyltransferase [Actinomycetota bacterium]
MRAADLIERGVEILKAGAANSDSPGDEDQQAEQILEEVLGREFDEDDSVDGRARRFLALIERRAAGEPLPYVLGWTEFMDLRLSVGPGAFVPRATTEFLAETAIARLRRRKAPVAVDAATGVGPIALAVASKVGHASVYGTDIAKPAVATARKNARALGLSNAHFRLGSMLEPLPRAIRGRVDVITSHPPYVASHEVADLPKELRDYEPHESLTDGSGDGLGLVRPLLAQGGGWLAPDGWMLIEIGSYLARAVRTLMVRAHYRDVRSLKGDMPYTRVIAGRCPR